MFAPAIKSFFSPPLSPSIVLLRYLDGSPVHPSIYSNLMKLLTTAKKSLKIASSYWSLRNVDVDDEGTNTSWQGENVFRGIFEAGKYRGIRVQIAQDWPSRSQPDHDTQALARGGFRLDHRIVRYS